MPFTTRSPRADAGFWWRALELWALIAVAETVHGVLRAILLVPWARAHRSNQIGVVAGSLIILLITRLMIRWLLGETSSPGRFRLLTVGAMWTTLMPAFEWAVGHYAFGRSWADLAQDYRVEQGGLLGFGMLVLLLSPLLAAGWRALAASV